MQQKTVDTNVPNQAAKSVSRGTWLKIQALSGAFFGLFAVVHLFNQAVAHLGVETYTNVQHKLRTVYQNPILEPLIFASLGVHMLANTIIIIRRWRRESDPKAVRSLTLSQKIQRWCGYLMAFLIVGHVFQTRFQQTFFDPKLDGDFALITYSLVYTGDVFYAYYFLFGSLGLFHLSYGLLKASDMFLGTRVHRRVTESVLFYFLMTLGSAGVMSNLLAFAGYYFNVQSPRVDMWVRHHEANTGVVKA
jgi:hypothetical protein